MPVRIPAYIEMTSTRGKEAVRMTDIALPMLLGFAVFMAGMKLMELALHRWGGGN